MQSRSMSGFFTSVWMACLAGSGNKKAALGRLFAIRRQSRQACVQAIALIAADRRLL